MSAPRRIVLLLALLTAFLFALRLLGPPNLTDNDQERPASYVLDALQNGHWLVQYDWTGDITSKPPAYTWLAALMSLPFKQPSLLTLYLPCALALFGSASLIATQATRSLGIRTALWAGVFLLANPLSAKLVALARTDPLFTFTVTLTSVLAFRAWESGKGWPLAWLAAAAATLTKGPLGLLLGFSGLLAWVFERRHGTPTPASRHHWTGAALWFAVCGGWFALAWASAGDPLIRKMLGAELVQHAVGAPGTVPGAGLVLAPAYFLSRFIPWSALTLIGLWDAFQRPEPDPTSRRLQRFAAAWLLAGLVVFGLASHQRGDLIAPLMPAGALLAAIPAARWTATWTPRQLVAAASALTLLLGVGSQIQHATRSRPVFAETRGLAELARRLSPGGASPTFLRQADAPYALQFFLGTMQHALASEDAARHLQASPKNLLAISDRAALERALGADASRLRTVDAWPERPPHRVEIVTLAPTSPSQAP